MIDTTPANPREELARQQRNMLLVNPITRLAHERNVIFKDEPGIADRLDVQFLALSAIDFVMERSAIESGAAPADITEHVSQEALRMNPRLTEEQARKVGRVILDYLSNRHENHKSFRVDYYDPISGAFSFHDFRLLSLFTASDGSVRFKLGGGAQTVTLAMLDVAPEFAQEAEAIMLERAVARGRFRDAHAIAQRSRMRSIHYQLFIEDKIFKVRRAADSVVWSEEVLPEMDRARAHLKDREQHEATIIDAVRENLAHATEESRQQLLDLKATIEECHTRHTHLFTRVSDASEEFLYYQARAFRARRKEDVPDIEEQLMQPLLHIPTSQITEMADPIWVAFGAPEAPQLFDLNLFFRQCITPVFRRDGQETEEDEHTEEIRPVPPEISEDEIEGAQHWLTEKLVARTCLDMREAVTLGVNEGMDDNTLRCVLFLMLRSWSPDDDPLGVLARIDGALKSDRAVGDNIVLEKEPAE